MHLKRIAAAGIALVCLAGAAFAQGTKPAAKRPATTAAKAKSPNATRKPLPARDPKTGRFIKKNGAQTKSMSKTMTKTMTKDKKK